MHELPDLSTLSHEQKDQLIRLLFAMVQDLTSRVAELEARLAKNSTNSSKPPSSDGLGKGKPKPKSLRPVGQKKTGGQPGHVGSTLERSAEPDHVVEYPTPSHCAHCSLPLTGHQVVQTRQVFDLPAIRYEVTEHRSLESRCTCGAVYRSQLPKELGSSLQYGPRILAAVVELTQHHMLPIRRTAMLVRDLFQLPISQAVIVKACKEAHQKLSATVASIGQAITDCPVVHVDETGLRVNSKLHWLHTAASETMTWIGCHTKRGGEAIADFALLEHCKGTLVHDGWAPYRELQNCEHALCNAHHLRELTYLHEEMGQKWAGRMIALLREACHTKNIAPNHAIEPKQISHFRKRYNKILREGEAQNPLQQNDGRKGRMPQSKASNLLSRLRRYADDVWRFATQAEVPFTNNLAEQAIRMPKVKQKVSGCLRTFHGAEVFCTIRSYLCTMQKQGHNLFQALTEVFQGRVPQPSFV